MEPMITVCRGCCGTHMEPVCPNCGLPCTTGSEQIRWGEKTGTEQIRWGEKTGFARAEIIGHATGSWANQREIVGNRDIVGNFREIVGAEGDPVTPGTPPPGPAPVAATPPATVPFRGRSAFQLAWEVVGMLSTPALIWHGYKRNDDSVLAGLGWGILSVVWPVTLPIAILVQGYAKPSADTRLKQAARAGGYPV